MSDYMKRRIQRLREELKRLHLDGILITNRPNRYYLSGFTGSSALLYITMEKAQLITDFRYLEQASNQCPEFEVIDQGTEGLIKTAIKLAEKDAIKTIGFESEHVSYSTYLVLKEHGNFEFLPTKYIVEKIRQIKDHKELEKMRQAAKIADDAFSEIIPFIKENYPKGLTEREIALKLESLMKEKGASKTSFDSIVAAGAKSSLPHAEPDQNTLKYGDFLVMDFGCVFEGYCSDMTRTIVLGEATTKHKEIYETVLKAQLEALNAIRGGVEGKKVDKVARDIITEAGYGQFFGHGLGHAVGIEIHENPRFSPGETNIIEEGMVITVEPGIYIPGFGGVRIEDMVMIKNEGIENFTHSPKELMII